MIRGSQPAHAHAQLSGRQHAAFFACEGKAGLTLLRLLLESFGATAPVPPVLFSATVHTRKHIS
jgi:hypothetical protein